ncbi:sigma-54-dependent transcriptional regulator [Candidatus Riflebacteria bacterium]
MKNGNILITDDEESVGFALKVLLEPVAKNVRVTSSGLEALEILKTQNFDILLTDINMPKMSGLELLEVVRKNFPNILVILLTAYGSEKIAVDAMKNGAYDYIPKPFDNDVLMLSVERALEKALLARKVNQLEKVISERFSFHSILGKSPAMQKIFDIIEKVGESQITVLVTGENGTGKEMICKALHYNSSSRDRPFIKLNCAALPETLIESELFGYEKGAFTDAYKQKLGKFELANQGTLFLDEIGDMSLVTQAKILRVLQEQEFERIGGDKTIKVDVRVIVATNKDLKAAIKKKEFREDLYFRLNILNIEVPPLRERKEDIPLLIEHFIKKFNKKFAKNIEGYDSGFLKKLLNYHWPGNVRELENTIERCMVLSDSDVLSEEFFIQQNEDKDGHLETRDFSYEHLFRLPFKEAKNIVVSNFEAAYIESYYQECNGNISQASQKAGMHRKNFYEKLKEYKISYKPADKNP